MTISTVPERRSLAVTAVAVNRSGAVSTAAAGQNAAKAKKAITTALPDFMRLTAVQDHLHPASAVDATVAALFDGRGLLLPTVDAVKADDDATVSHGALASGIWAVPKGASDVVSNATTHTRTEAGREPAAVHSPQALHGQRPRRRTPE